MSDFDGHDYYDFDKGGELRHESVGELIADWADTNCSRVGEPVSVTLDLVPPAGLFVAAWQRRKIEERYIIAAALAATDTACESIDEEFGDPEGSPSFYDHAHEQLAASIADALREALVDWTPWTCERVAERRFSRDEVEAILREECPEWFEEAK